MGTCAVPNSTLSRVLRSPRAASMLLRWALTKSVACSSVNMAASRHHIAGVGLGSPVDHRRACSKPAGRPAGTTSRSPQDWGPAADSVAEGPGTTGSAAKGFATASFAAEGSAAAGSAAEGPAVAGSAAEGPTAAGSSAEGSATVGSATEGPATAGSAAEGLATVGFATGAAASSWHADAISCQTGDTAL